MGQLHVIEGHDPATRLRSGCLDLRLEALDTLGTFLVVAPDAEAIDRALWQFVKVAGVGVIYSPTTDHLLRILVNNSTILGLTPDALEARWATEKHAAEQIAGALCVGQDAATLEKVKARTRDSGKVIVCGGGD